MVEALTAKRISDFVCKDGKNHSFLRDSNIIGLGVRASAGGSKQFILEKKLSTGNNIRITIGDVRTWTIAEARAEARRLIAIIDQGRDPREERRERAAADAASRALARQKKAVAMDAWEIYVQSRSPEWSLSYRADHEKVSTAGGKLRTKGKRPGESDKTQPGILRPLLMLPFSEITPHRVKTWLTAESKKRPTHTRIAFAILRAFLNWAAENSDYSGAVHADACTSGEVRRKLPPKKAKTDCLERGQLQPWFSEVRKLPNTTVSAFLQILLLCGPRRNELASLRWADVDLKWQKMTLHDKVEGDRTISMPPYVRSLLLTLKAINDTPPPTRILTGKVIQNDLKNWKPSPFVFASRTSASGYLQDPGTALGKCNTAAGIPNVTQHGLRRSFKTLSEWVEAPAGVVAQIMGHKPSATAEKHYTVRPIDLLRMWHTRIEGWMLTEAGIEQPTAEATKERKLKKVSG